MPAVRGTVVGLLFVLSLIASPDGARAQEVGQAGEARTFGPTSLVRHTLQAYAFVGLTASDSAAFTDGGLGSRS